MADLLPLDPYGAFVNTANTEARTRSLDAITAEKVLDTQIKSDSYKRYLDFQGRAAQIAAAADKAIPIDQIGATAQGADGGASPTVGADAALKRLERDALTQGALAREATVSGMKPEDVNKYVDNARQANEAVEKARTRSLEEKKRIVEDTGRALSQMDNPTTFYAGLEGVRQQAAAHGIPFQESMIKMGFRPSLDGSFEPNETNMAAAKLNALKTIPMKEQLEALGRDEMRQARIANLQSLEEHRKQVDMLTEQRDEARRNGQADRLEVKNKELQLAQQRLEQAAARFEQQSKDSATKRGEGVIKNVQVTLGKADPYAQYEKFDRAATLANNIGDKLKTSPGYDNLDGSDALALKQASQQAMANFRARDPGKWLSKEIETSANGAFQRLEKYWSTIGEGTPSLSRKGAQDIIGTINTLNNINRAESLAVESEAQRSAVARGGNPTGLALKAASDVSTLLQLEKEGLAKVTRDSEKRITAYTVGGRTFKVSELTPKGE
jgi:hypothetical protein